jgi:hypothetical protein
LTVTPPSRPGTSRRGAGRWCDIRAGQITQHAASIGPSTPYPPPTHIQPSAAHCRPGRKGPDARVRGT